MKNKFPKRYGNCKCQCHNIKTIMHVVPCCSPETEKVQIDELKKEGYIPKKRKDLD